MYAIRSYYEVVEVAAASETREIPLVEPLGGVQIESVVPRIVEEGPLESEGLVVP